MHNNMDARDWFCILIPRITLFPGKEFIQMVGFSLPLVSKGELYGWIMETHKRPTILRSVRNKHENVLFILDR